MNLVDRDVEVCVIGVVVTHRDVLVFGEPAPVRRCGVLMSEQVAGAEHVA